MLFEDTKILEFNQNQKFDKPPFIVYEDLECLIEKNDECKNNAENLSTARVREDLPSGSRMSTILSFKSMENKYDL